MAEIQFLLADAAYKEDSLSRVQLVHIYCRGLTRRIVTMGNIRRRINFSGYSFKLCFGKSIRGSSTSAGLKIFNTPNVGYYRLVANFVESWNNWKRSGYPVLTPVITLKPSSVGQIPRKTIIPCSESQTTNPDKFG